MQVLIDNKKCLIDEIGYNDGLNYGRFDNCDTQEYTIELTQSEFIELIEDEYILIKNEIQLDDELNNDNSEFKESNYCSLKELFQYENQFVEIVKTYLDRKLYSKIFKNSTKARFIINSTYSVMKFENRIHITGKCFINYEV